MTAGLGQCPETFRNHLRVNNSVTLLLKRGEIDWMQVVDTSLVTDMSMGRVDQVNTPK